MSEINRYNYEAFCLDYLEGNLDPSSKAEFIRFLNKNPDIKAELEDFDHIRLHPPEKVQFPNKFRLKKTERGFSNNAPFEEQCIERMEGDMSAPEAKLFDRKLSENPEQNKIFILYKQTKLHPDYNITYPNKKQLKAPSGKTRSLFTTSRIIALAASVILLVGLFINFSTDNSNKYNYATHLKYISLDNSNQKYVEKNAQLQTIETNYNHTTDVNIEHNNLLSKPSIQNNKLYISSNTLMQKLNPLKISKLQITGNVKTMNNLADISEKHLKLSHPTKTSLSKTALAIKLNRPLATETINEGNSDFSFLDIADLGFRGISKLTGKDIELHRRYNKDGKLKELAFRSESFSFSTNIKN